MAVFQPPKELTSARPQTSTTLAALDAYEVELNRKLRRAARKARMQDNNACIDRGMLSCVFTDRH